MLRTSRKRPSGPAFVVPVQQPDPESIPVMEPCRPSAYMVSTSRECDRVIEFGRISAGKVAVALGAAGLLLTPAIAADSKRRAPGIAFSAQPTMTFTPASADPRLAASLARGAPSLADFKFTPAAARSRPSQVRVAIRARASSPALASANGSASPVSAPCG